MVYYIVPPIIMIVSLAFLIMFLSKKMSQIPEDAILKQAQELAEEKNLEGKLSHRISQFFLHFLEKMTRRFKLLSLKIHNASDRWTHSIKEKREQREKIKEEALRIQEENKQEETQSEESLIEEVKSIDIGAKAKKRRPLPKEIDEEKVAPMISSRVVRPEPKPEPVEPENKEYENLLIERIALNPRDIEAYERLGEYYLAKNNNEDALECFKQVVKLNPLNRKAKSNIRQIEKILKG